MDIDNKQVQEQKQETNKEQFYYHFYSSFEHVKPRTAPCDVWWKVRDELEKKHEICLTARNKINHSCLVGFLFVRDKVHRNTAKEHVVPRGLTEIRDEYQLGQGEEIILKILPKHAVKPPPLHLKTPVAPKSLTPQERMEWIQEAVPVHPVERIGDEPPAHYVCRNCRRKGHYYRHCPWQGGGFWDTQEERLAARPLPAPAGIPKTMLKTLREQSPGSFTKDGVVYSGDWISDHKYTGSNPFLQK